MFKCTDCQKVVRKVEDVRSCWKCGKVAASSIPTSHSNDDWLTPAILGYMVGTSFNSHAVPPDPTPAPFSGDGGEFSGAGATVSYDSPSSDSSSDNSSSSDSSSSTGSSSSDSGSSSPSE